MLISVVGPSRGGKSTLLASVLPEFPNIILLDLDAEENRAVATIKAAGGDPGGWDARWNRNLALLKEADAAPRHVVADVGAGSLQTKEGRRFFIERGARVIAVVAPWEVVLSRHPGRDVGEFRRTEFSDERRRVYDAAASRVNTDSSLEEAIADFRNAIGAIVGDPTTAHGGDCSCASV